MQRLPIIHGLLLLTGIAVIGFAARSTSNAAPNHHEGARQQARMGAEEALRRLLTTQAAAWNRGDIEGFMEGYWKSDQTTFSGSSGVSRGWQALLDRYRKNYSTRAIMGHLEFSELEITPLGDDAALILGRWHLDRESGPSGGVFTLVARRFPEGWRIIHDHTSEVVTGKAIAHP
jgi:uncharacterized protein (TIGR02246 family)